MVGRRLRELRKRRRITQTEMANMLGITESAISTYESEKVEPTHKNLIRISKFFNVSIDYLMGVIDKPVPAYNEDNIISVPKNISEDEKTFIKEYINFINFRKNNK